MSRIFKILLWILIENQESKASYHSDNNCHINSNFSAFLRTFSINIQMSVFYIAFNISVEWPSLNHSLSMDCPLIMSPTTVHCWKKEGTISTRRMQLVSHRFSTYNYSWIKPDLSRRSNRDLGAWTGDEPWGRWDYLVVLPLPLPPALPGCEVGQRNTATDNWRQRKPWCNSVNKMFS